MIKTDCLRRVVAEQPYPLLFASISGAHLYGFPSADSDYDLRGVHILPLPAVVGLRPQRETIECAGECAGVPLDLVTHDVRKFLRLLLKRNGYVLEQLHSPLVIWTTPEHAKLRAIARGLVTRQHAPHYLGFARTQWQLFERQRRIKPLLYVYRVLLTGVHLMRTGNVEANLAWLNATFRLSQVDELIAQKVDGAEMDSVGDTDFALHEREYARLVAELEAARDATSLPDEPAGRDALDDLLVKLRLHGWLAAGG